MMLTDGGSLRCGKRAGWLWSALALLMSLAAGAWAQGVTTTTVQGTVYLANGKPGAGTLTVSWPAFTTATGQAVAADRMTVTIPADGFVSVNLAPNQGAQPAGEYYTAVFYMSDGTASTQYWVVPAAAQATLAQVQAKVMPAAQAVQAVSKAYVDQAISELTQSLLTASGGNMSGPLYLSGDPTQPLQAADKHYVDTQVASALPLAGGSMTGGFTTPAVNGVRAPAAGSSQTTLQTAVNAAGTNGAVEIPPTYAGTDTFTNPNGVRVADLRSSGAQPAERSVKEFGAVCDGATDDTNALQAALSYAHAHGVALTIPQGTCKTHSLSWRGESIGGMGKQVSALMGFPGQDVLVAPVDSMSILSNTRLHDLTIYVDQSMDVSCSSAAGRASAGSCQVSRPMEKNSIFSPGGNGLNGTAGSGAAWAVGNCAVAMPASTGLGGNGLKTAVVENLEIAAAGTDPMAATYPGAHSTHTCGLYLAQWPQWSEFRNIDIRGLNTGIAMPALPVAAPAGLNADSNRWENVTIEATHAFTAAAGSNNVLDNVVAHAGNSAATAEPPTGLVLDFAGDQQGWTARNAVVMPAWNAVPPALKVTASGGAVTAVTVGPENGLGWDPYGTTVPLSFSSGCTAAATAAVNSNGSIGAVTVTRGGAGCSSTTTAQIDAAGTWDTAAPVNLVSGRSMSFFAGNLLKGQGGYTVWNATDSSSYGTQLAGGGGALPGGGSYAAMTGSGHAGSVYQVDQFAGSDFGAKLQACVNAMSGAYGGSCDARNFTGNQSMASNLTIATGNTAVLLPCATINTQSQIIVTAGTRNVTLRGCALRGGSAASGSEGGTVFAYSGTGAMIQVGDPAYATDTPGFHIDNVVINTTASSSASAQAFVAYRAQELDLANLYLLGNSNQTGITLDGTGNYTGGTFLDDQISGFQTAVNAIGHQTENSATTDWMNASTFVRLHIDCPTSNGTQIAGTFGINLQQGDGNTFTGGDVEGCATALHLGPNAQNNTIVGLRNENSTKQVVADTGSKYNNWITGGTMFAGQLVDNGTRNSFLDTFHRSFNALNVDWYGSQQDATLTNHFRLGTGTGNERGLMNEYQTDYGYRWMTGLSDATGGEQFYEVQDLLNNVYRLSIGQYNNGHASTNNQTVINSAGTGAVVLNGSNNSGTGGVVFGSGGANETTVATISSAGNAQFNGALQVGGTTQSTGTITARNNADAEVDYYLWPGLTATQKGSFVYKDFNGNSQWYMVKDTSNNWALNSAIDSLDHFKAYQGGDNYINAGGSGVVRINNEASSGTGGFIVYSGGASPSQWFSVGASGYTKVASLAGTGHRCVYADASGGLNVESSDCGSTATSATINAGSANQIAYYTGNGAAIGGLSTVPVTAGGTGAADAQSALASLGAVPLTGGTMTGALAATQFNGPLTGNVTGNASTATHASNLPPDFAAQSAAGPAAGTFTTVAASSANFGESTYNNAFLSGFPPNCTPGPPSSFDCYNNVAVGVGSMQSATTALNNVAVGQGALGAATSSGYNVAVGWLALSSVTDNTANSDVAVGSRTMVTSTSNSANNVAVGTQAMRYNTTGANNTVISGFNGMASNTTGNSNSVVGYQAMTANVGGSNNVAVGDFALGTGTAGNQNVAVGSGSAYDFSGNGMVAVGYEASRLATVPATAVGYTALLNLTTGTSNTAVGNAALYSLTTGANNTALGYNTLQSLTTGSSNIGVGYNALLHETAGSNNTAVGQSSQVNSNGASQNTSVGYHSLTANVTGTNNTAVGYGALTNATAGGNTAVGANAASALTSGTTATAIGYNALTANTTGSGNTALGYVALQASTTDTNSTALGAFALAGENGGGYNTAVGNSALRIATTGTANTAVGYEAGFTGSGVDTTGSNNTWLGYYAGTQSATQIDNSTAIGYNAQNTQSNQVVLGNSSVTRLCVAGTTACFAVSSSTGTLVPPASGVATLASGTATVATTAACAAGSTCNYQLTNCGVSGTQGMLSVGTVTAGTSFAINSSSAADTSKVCWRIN